MNRIGVLVNQELQGLGKPFLAVRYPYVFHHHRALLAIHRIGEDGVRGAAPGICLLPKVDPEAMLRDPFGLRKVCAKTDANVYQSQVMQDAGLPKRALVSLGHVVGPDLPGRVPPIEQRDAATADRNDLAVGVAGFVDGFAVGQDKAGFLESPKAVRDSAAGGAAEDVRVDLAGGGVPDVPKPIQ